MNQNGGIHKGGFAVLCHRNGGLESPGILNHFFNKFSINEQNDFPVLSVNTETVNFPFAGIVVF